MAGSTKNLGQVAGVHIGNTPPSNTILIWYDNTPSQQRHKVYDPTLKQWVVLDQTTISAITYSELVNQAKNTGLSVGEWFQITDRSNALALAITSTKVQYTDTLGNILIDDLGTNIQYHVTSSNLSIDDISGVFDETNKKLVFQFNENTPDFTADDYVLGKVRRNNIWSLAKYKLSSFLSKVTGNSITWNGGFFFNFTQAIQNILDKKGGIVSKDTYDTDKTQLTQSINNVGKENQEIIQNANKAITQATTDDSIYGKKLPSIATGGEPTDIAKGDTLQNIVNKLQRWITRFKFATGIRLSADFTDNVSGKVNNNDTVEMAIAKLSNNQQKTDERTGTDIKICTDDFQQLDENPNNISKQDSIYNAVQKLWYWIKHITTDFIVDNAVTTAKIANNAVTEQKLANGSVSTSKIGDNAVTEQKVTDGSITTSKIADGAITEQKILNNSITVGKLSNNLRLFTAVQLIVTCNVNIYSASLIFYESVETGSADWSGDVPVFEPMGDDAYFNNVSGVINAGMAYYDSPKELTGYGALYFPTLKSVLKARLVVNLRSTGVNGTTANVTPKIMFRDGRVNEYQQSIQAYELHNIDAKSNYLVADFDVNANIYNYEGFKIWIKVESSNN